MTEYRVTCTDGAELDRFDGRGALRWASLAASNADLMHDGARCTTPHRIEMCVGWQEVKRGDLDDLVGCDACNLPTPRADLAGGTSRDEGSFCSGCREGLEPHSPAHTAARAEGAAEALA